LSVVFFTDRDLGLRFPDILSSAGLSVQRHKDYFPHDCGDVEWLSAVATRGWVILTHDTRIRYKPNELAAVVKHSARLLVIIGRVPHADLARSFVSTVPRVLEFLETHEAPLIGKVYRASAAELERDPSAAGHVEPWYPKRPGSAA
jgi:predicted nuclease of predicted toxin-antitoxin system